MRPMLALTLCLIATAPTTAEADCTCIYAGGNVEHGQTACISTAKGKRLARCDKVLNNSSWTILDEACDIEQSSNVPGPSPHSGEGPGVGTSKINLKPRDGFTLLLASLLQRENATWEHMSIQQLFAHANFGRN
jgi:hypothetical protein